MKKFLFSAFVSFAFFRTLGQVSFISTYTANLSGGDIATGDFNNDGKPDLSIISNTLEIFLGSGTGNFSSHSHNLNQNLSGICVADLNNDSKSDIILGNSSNGVNVVLSDGNGGYTSNVNYPSSAIPRSLVSGDFNNDGNIDIACTNWSANTISVWFGNGLGALTLVSTYTASSGPINIKCVDLNKDNKPDLVFASNWAFNISVLLNNGSGVFLPAVNYPTPRSPYYIDFADLDQDNNLDLLTLNYEMTAGTPQSLSVFKGNGDGTFQVCLNDSVSSIVGVIRDFDLDGKLDIVTNGNYYPLIFTKGSGDLTFGASVPVMGLTSIGAKSVCSADFDLDGKPDLAYSAGSGSSGMEVFLNRTSGSVGLKEEDLYYQVFSLYPNPSTGKLFFTSKYEVEISVLNELGVTLNCVVLNLLNGFTGSIENLYPGAYVIIGKAKGFTQTKKAIIVK